MLTSEKLLRDSKKRLEKYISNLKKSGDAECDRWLADNSVMLMQSIINGLRVLKKHRTQSADAVFEILLRCLGGTQAGDANTIFTSKLKENDIPLDMCGELASLTFAAAALRAVNAYSQHPDAFGSYVRVLFLLRDTDFDALTAEVCEAERLLTLDPTNDYEKFDKRTKFYYRKAVCKAAEKRGMTVTQTLGEILDSATHSDGIRKHIGFHLSPEMPDGSKGKLFIAAEFAVAIILSVILPILFTVKTIGFFGSVPGRAVLAVLIFLPVFGAIHPITDRICARLFKPAFLPSFDPEKTDRLPPTVIAVSSILPSADKTADIKEHLRVTKLSDSSADTSLVFLCDPKNANVPSLPEDAADIRAAKKMIDELNEESGGGFVFAMRDRFFAPSENSYGGYERKRGALCTLVRLIKNGENGFSELTGDTEKLKSAKYLLALDSDTVLPFESLKKLVCVAAHPLNRPVFSADKRRITQGYGIIAPRVETSAGSAEKTFFSSFMTLCGVGAYSFPVSERYMDMFATSLFTGKGLIDIDAFSKTCTDAFSDGIILSHDIPEGALMRTAFAGNVCLADSFPSKPSSYRKREHRWIRGDMQNLTLLTGTTNGSASAAKLTPLAKYQLLDNLRRALTPAACFVCLILSVFTPKGAAGVLLTMSVLSVISEPALSFINEFVRLGIKALTSIYLTASAGVGLKALIRAVYLVAALPEDAAVSFSAVTKGLFRGFVSRKKTLEWTTAAEGEREKMRSGAECVFSVASAAVLFFGLPLCRFIAVLILFNVPFSVSDGIRTARTAERLSSSDRETLKSYAAAEWLYFEKYVTAEEHFLPPDNVQFSPVKRIAHRTSPTDIGLYLLSCLTAADLSLIDENELQKRLSDTVRTLQKLRRCAGLLCNWYDTRTLEVLPPYFVSTVDCGNYLACLFALGEGLRKMPSGTEKFRSVIDFINAEITSSDLGVLYSKRRGLFSVGMNCDDKTLSPSFYDTYMSEMRLTSFYAIALREVPVAHNEKLSRSSVSSGMYTSVSSWTGTAFEYLMPTLFLPIYANTFVGEALFNCVREQKKLTRGTPMPWGVSESGYYAFDRDLNYRYKAHGIRSLAIKADADCETVFSPYSSFLALAVAPNDAMKNLARFVSLGGFGACGFYEALDFTSERVAPENYMTVRSFMAHHKGMSIIACGNALFDGINVRRFAGNASMRAADSLLTEKLPSEAPFTTRRKKKKEVGEKRSADENRPSNGNYSARCAFYSDGESALICTADGRNKYIYSSLSVFGKRICADGIFAAVRTDGITVPLSQNGSGSLKNSCYYSKNVCSYGVFEHALCLPHTLSGVLAPVKITNTTKTEKDYEVLFYAEPELTLADGGDTHKSYSDMFIKTSYNSELHCVTFERRKHGSPVAAIALGFAGNEPFVFTCNRCAVLSANESVLFPFENGTPVFDNSVSGVAPCFAAKIHMRILPGDKRESVLIAAAGDDLTDAVNKLSRIRTAGMPKIDFSYRSAPVFADSVRKTAENYLMSRYFGATDKRQHTASQKNTLPLASLWEKGISGDLGIVRAAADETPRSLFADLIDFHSAFSKAGCPFDLVFTLFAPDDYSSSSSEKLRAVIRKKHAENLLGARGGIHIINLGSGSPVDTLLNAVSDAAFPSVNDCDNAKTNRNSYITELAAGAIDGGDGFVPNGYFINKKTRFPMSLTLSNGTIGTLVTSSSLGFTWFANARLCPLTPRPYDETEPMTGELLTLEQNGRVTDIINGASVFFTDNSAIYKSTVGAVRCDTAVIIAKKGAVKEIRVRLKNLTRPCSLAYTLTPVMCEKREFARMCRTEETENGVIVSNPFNADYKGFMFVGCEKSHIEFTDNGKIRLTLNFNGKENTADAVFKIIFSVTKFGLDALNSLKISPFEETRMHFSSGAEELDTFANALLVHQAADSRIRSRTGFYQCSGAFGFRDQLQDGMCLSVLSPKTAKRIILLCAAAQFREGDVLHWFHLIPTEGKKGVRTRCSDDLLWLPLAAAVYSDNHGSSEIFKTEIPYLDGKVLADGEQQRYELFRRSNSAGTLYEHCMKSIFKACEFGSHGLPLIKDGDWNDSFGEIGEKGKGESVWLAMFLKLVCDKMLPYVTQFGKVEHSDILKKISAQMNENVTRRAFNGEFFARAFFDDGTPLGFGEGDACRIDLLPQSFASFAKIGTADMRRSALLHAYSELVDRENGIVKLFSPPFSEKTRRAGYVNDYPEGVRENGGQYTHAAVWFAIALLHEGLKREAAEVTGLLLPSLKDERYMREPYAMCGDVYSAHGAEGKGGWSLYTGAAGWMLALTREWEKQSQKEINDK